MNVCPCGRYKQLNSVLYPNNHTEIVKINSYGLVLKEVLVGNLKVGKPRLCCFFFKTQDRILHYTHISKYMFANSLK